MIKGVDISIENIRKRIERLRSERAVYLAAKGTMVEVSERVWGKGELTDGSTLTYKDDRELYAYTPPSPRKVTGKGKPYKLWKDPPRTKRGSIKAGAASIKGGWYEDYSALKEQQGRADHPFEMTGRFRKAYFGGTDVPDPHQDSDTEVTIRLSGEEAEKYLGLTDSKGPFLKLAQAEIDGYHKRLLAIYNEP